MCGMLEETAVQSTVLFLFCIVEKTLQTGSVVKKSAAAANKKDMSVSQRFR